MKKKKKKGCRIAPHKKKERQLKRLSQPQGRSEPYFFWPRGERKKRGSNSGGRGTDDRGNGRASYSFPYSPEGGGRGIFTSFWAARDGYEVEEDEHRGRPL